MSQLSHEYPDATPEELVDLAAAALLKATTPEEEGVEYETRTCRYCPQEFRVRADARHNKWNSLCRSCLAYEI